MLKMTTTLPYPCDQLHTQSILARTCLSSRGPLAAAALMLVLGNLACQDSRSTGATPPPVAEANAQPGTAHADTLYTVQLDIDADGKHATLRNASQTATVGATGEASLDLAGAKIRARQATHPNGGYSIALKGDLQPNQDVVVEVHTGDQVGVVCETKQTANVEVDNYLKACSITLHGTAETSLRYAHRETMQAEARKRFEAAAASVQNAAAGAADKAQATGQELSRAAGEAGDKLKERGKAAAGAIQDGVQAGSNKVAEKVGQATEATGAAVESAGAKTKEKGHKVKTKAH